MHLPYKKSASILIFLWTCFSPISYSTFALARPFSPLDLLFNKGKYEFKLPTPPPNRGGANRFRGAGPSGATCETISESEVLTALVPLWGGYSLTTDSYPTFWFYIPFEASNALSIRFKLWNQNGYNYESQLGATRKKPGVISVRLPSTEEGLNLNEEYTWSLIATCQDTQTSFLVKGSITRVERTAELGAALQEAVIAGDPIATQRNQGEAYAQNGIWYDALTILGDLRRAAPENELFKQDWVDLLGSVELDDVTQKPIVRCCSPSGN